ncbi:sugar phosphate isomerase/epimerase family protein [Nonomuraea aridisoli]|uniref:Sugar phosphate isomerase/epimerase n=1 Tax=Nonomuraea aridisoli TaxID=2070368 RepID=A0A2W2G746_9ACTN|nr:sugar phosphate isomerase/epimerase [Nonomuraea aridisoli]PZG22684.1 sugar phosphate isomerase/epimerase [Nonomuraea aridisoli]
MTSPFGVQLYTVREELAADRVAVLRRIAIIGYGAVEPYDPLADPEGLRRLADDLGLRVPATHASALLRREPAEVFEAVATLGAGLVIVPGGVPHEEFTTLDGLARTADLLNDLAEQAAGYGLRLGYHNHWWEIEPRLDGRHALEVLADRLAPEVFLEIDTYWAAVGGADVPALLGRLAERTLALHVKDGPGVKDRPHTAVGQGVMPVPDILAAAPGALRIVELDECADDIFAVLAESHAYLSSLEGS